MRLWTVHPNFLDAKGLVALWREGLLAKAVLEGKTRGYRNHPQLIRFRDHGQPAAAICEYLRIVHAESKNRGYRFDSSKIPAKPAPVTPIEETRGQLNYEWAHLLRKLEHRDPERYLRLVSHATGPAAHPLFTIVEGEIREWENVAIANAST